MSKRMLIDASHPEETRVVVLDGNKVEEFDFEAASRRPLKGNVYLAKVTRVEPSLQAAFVEYGGNRQGFLAFSEIHPDYYQIPVADRLALIAAQTERRMAEEDEGFDSVAIQQAPTQATVLGENQDEPGPERREGTEAGASEEEAQPEEEPHADQTVAEEEDQGAAEAPDESHDEETDDALAEHASGEEEEEEESAPSAEAELTESSTEEQIAEATGTPARPRRRERNRDRRGGRHRPYKIQEVIKRRQIMLVQVVKEERGNKGAALTTFLSLAGRYCVLMPNTPRGGGISRKITSATDRARLKSAVQSLELPEGMGLIIRTAGANRTKAEIKRDYEYLIRLWDTVRELTLKSNAPALVYEEGNLVKRAIRDLYNKDILEVLVDGEVGYRDAKDFMRMLLPSHAKNVKLYKETLPLFQRYHIDAQLDAMFSPTVTLRSGGYLVINQTEALVSIDVNSGKATREHSIEETAHKTNLEAADEIARQLRLRDLAGLIVIDFIDMEDAKNDRNVEKRLRDALRGDRARVQVAKISQFGLLEMSRQRLRAGVIAGSTVTCPHCGGQGIVRSTESAALRLLRALDEEGHQRKSVDLRVKTTPDVAIYALNQKRRELSRIEDAYDFVISFDPQPGMAGGSFEIERTAVRAPTAPPKSAAVSPEAGLIEREAAEDVTLAEPPEEEMLSEEVPEEGAEAAETGQHAPGTTAQEGGEGRRRRRRRRRGGRNRNSDTETDENQDQVQAESETSEQGATLNAQEQRTEGSGEIGERRRRRRRRGRRGRQREAGEPQGKTVREASAQEETPTEPPTSRSALPPFELPTSPVNAPSEPQWSLSAEPPGTEGSARAALKEPEPQHMPETAPPASQTAMASAPAPSEPQDTETNGAADEQPHESRKGWWQRRFKIGQ